jgi:hypothetical protein
MLQQQGGGGKPKKRAAHDMDLNNRSFWSFI